jgi:hypothetical protein
MQQFLQQNLNSKFEVSTDTETDYNLSSLNSFTDNNFRIVEDYKLICDKKINFLFVSTNSTDNDFDNNVPEYFKGNLANYNFHNIQLWAVLTSKNNYEHTLLKSESLKDKIIDFFIKQDIDYQDDKEFSKNFYIMSNNSETAKNYFSKEMRTAILKFKDSKIIIELKGDKIYVGTENNFQEDASLLNNIVDFFNVV